MTVLAWSLVVILLAVLWAVISAVKNSPVLRTADEAIHRCVSFYRVLLGLISYSAPEIADKAIKLENAFYNDEITKEQLMRCSSLDEALQLLGGKRDAGAESKV